MRENQFDTIKDRVQEIIDLIALKENQKASIKIVEMNQLLEEAIDFSTNDEDLIEISRFQLLLTQLSSRINNSN
jgi:hypothetical protein